MHMRQPLALSVATMLLLLLAPSALAKDAWKNNLEQALEARYPLSKQAGKKLLGVRLLASNDIQRLGTVFAVAIENVVVEPVINNNSLKFATIIEAGHVQQSGGGVVGGLFGSGVQRGRRSLSVGERITPVEYDVKDDAVQLTFVTVETTSYMYSGTQFSDHLFGVLLFKFPPDFLSGATIDQVAPAIEAVLTRASEKGPGPAKIALGQSSDDVQRAFGTPDKVIELGSKTIWVYKDMKVVFQDGKVSDVQ